LVNAITLAGVSEDLEFGSFLLMSRGEAKDSSRGRKYILANTFEALVGAIYLDQGYNQAESFIQTNLINKKLPAIVAGQTFKDAKSLFQEKSQAVLGITPVYKVLEQWGPDHDRRFKSGVFLDEELVADGEGASKQEAEIEAAKAGLMVKNWQI